MEFWFEAGSPRDGHSAYRFHRFTGDAAVIDIPPSIQMNWRWCEKCTGLHFAGNPNKGACPAGGQHVSTGSGNYTLAMNDALAPGQSNWRWCEKCTGLHFAGNPNKTPAPAGGQHVSTGSGNYTLVHNDSSGSGPEQLAVVREVHGAALRRQLNGVPAQLRDNVSTGSGNYTLVHF